MNRHAPYASMTWIRFHRVGLSPLSRKAPLVTRVSLAAALAGCQGDLNLPIR